MPSGCSRPVLWLGLALAAAPMARACAQQDAWSDPETRKTLDAMTNASTWYHPDLFGMTVGTRRYAHREFRSALHYFEIGAYYADKLSQLDIGLMHLNGEGTEKDPVVAYAWIDLAAERDYPAFVATRERVKQVLTPEQMERAMKLREALGERYGDKAAKWRMTLQLRQGQMQFTGSRTGFDFGFTQAGTACGPALRIGGRQIPQVGCPGPSFMAKENWDPDLYFAERDQEWKPNVSVGPIVARPADAYDHRSNVELPASGPDPRDHQ